MQLCRELCPGHGVPPSLLYVEEMERYKQEVIEKEQLIDGVEYIVVRD